VFRQQLRKVGDSFVLAIPDDEVARLGLEEDQVVEVSLEIVDGVALPPDLQVALDRLWPRLEPGLNYLKDR
jgi:hypothetical protein